MAGSTPASLSAEAPVQAPAVAAAQARKARSISPALETWRRFRRHVLAVTGAIVLLILVPVLYSKLRAAPPTPPIEVPEGHA